MDDLDKVLDSLEEKNDAIHSQLRELLADSRQVRELLADSRQVRELLADCRQVRELLADRLDNY